MAKPLDGKEIAILVETEYIPHELAEYDRLFAELGAKVHYLANVRSNKRIHIVSDVDGVIYQDPNAGPDQSEPDLQKTRERLEIRVVTEDIREEMNQLSKYAAVLVAANYTSVRHRWFPTNAQKIAPSRVRESNAVQFVSRALRNPRIVVGALCHGLWLLSPVPELLAGRRVVCHEVILADAYNAGASYDAPELHDMFDENGGERDYSGWKEGDPMPTTVAVDGNLVTARSAKDVVPYIFAIKDRIVQVASETTAPKPLPGTPPDRHAAKRILVVLSEYGYWGEELIGPMQVFDREGYKVNFATPRGGRPRALAPSMSDEYIDPPLGRCVTSAEMAATVREWDDMSPGRGSKSKRLDNPINLSEKIPARPYWSAPQVFRGLEGYYRKLDREVTPELVQPYDCLLIVGGSGPIVDLVNNERVHDLILAYYRAGKPIAAECYGVACLAFARDPQSRRSILLGKRVTGHCLEYDYKAGTGFLDPNTWENVPEAGFINFDMGPPPYPLEFILRDATAPDGEYIGNFGKATSVIVDYPFITGRCTPDSILTGEQIVRVLKGDRTPFGW